MRCHVSVPKFINFFFIFFKLFLKNYKFATCQADIMPHDSDSVMWQWQCHVSLLCQVSFSYSKFGPVF